MPLSTTAIDVNRGTSGIALPQDVLDQVLQGISEGSAVMQLANRLVIPGTGVKMNVITGDPTPAWVAESTEKTVSEPTFANKTMVPYKLAVIVPFSDQFRRDMATLYDAVVTRIPNALARAFDQTVLYGAAPYAAPGANFDTLSAADAVVVSENSYDATVGVMTSIATAGGNLNGFILSPQANGVYMTARNSGGDLEFPGYAPGQNLLDVPTFTRSYAYQQGSSADNTLGFAGDWSKAWYGIVEDVAITYADQATLNDGSQQINLWQRNMFAVRAEMEVGFIVEDTDYFARLTDNAQA